MRGHGEYWVGQNEREELELTLSPANIKIQLSEHIHVKKFSCNICGCQKKIRLLMMKLCKLVNYTLSQFFQVLAKKVYIIFFEIRTMLKSSGYVPGYVHLDMFELRCNLAGDWRISASVRPTVAGLMCLSAQTTHNKATPFEFHLSTIGFLNVITVNSHSVCVCLTNPDGHNKGSLIPYLPHGRPRSPLFFFVLRANLHSKKKQGIKHDQLKSLDMIGVGCTGGIEILWI